MQETCNPSKTHRNWAGKLKLIALCLALIGLPLPVRAQLKEDDAQLLNYILNSLKYADTAERFIDKLLDKYGADQAVKADLEWRKVDIHNLRGESDQAAELSKVLQKKYPKHSRSSLADLGSIGREMAKVTAAFDKATTDPENAAKHHQAGIEVFEKNVEPSLNAMVTDLNAKLKTAQEKYIKARRANPDAPPPKEYRSLRGNRDNVELVRISVLRVFAGVLRSVPSLATKRSEVLNKGLAYAQTYVEERANNRLLQWQAQMQKGRYEIELEKNAEAYDSISVLLGIRPPVPRGRPVPADLVDYMKKLHIEAVLYASQAANHAGLHEEAVDAVESYMLGADKGPFALNEAHRDPKLETYFFLAQLERAIGIAGGGDTTKGLAEVQSLIDKYKSQGNDPKSQAFVNDARKGLGRIAEVSGAKLNAESYYEGGMGKFSERRFEEAVSLFLNALDAANSKDRKDVVPKTLIKIAEIQYILGRNAEAVMTFLELHKWVPLLGKDDLSIKKAANDAMSIATTAARANRGHAGYQALEKLADAFLNEVGGDIPPGLREFVKAQEAELQGDLAGAIDIYGGIQEVHEGKPEPVYLRAQAKVIDCKVQQWLLNAKKDDPDVVAQIKGLLAPLSELGKKAKEAGKLQAQIVCSWAAAQIYLNTGDQAKAVEALIPFQEEYASDTQYRAAALYYLLENQIALEMGAEAEVTYKPLKSDYPDHISSYYGALQLMEYFRGKGEAEKAAQYILDYASHEKAAEEIKTVGRIMDIVDLLLEAGLLEEAKKWLARAEAIVGDDDSPDGKRVYFRRAKLSFQEKDYATVITALSTYIKKYGEPKSSEEDGPYILQMLGESHLRQSIANKSLKVSGLKLALINLAKAVNGIKDRRDLEDSGERSKAERAYWTWSYLMMFTYKKLGDAGSKKAWVKIRRFIVLNKNTNMGGAKLKARFTKLLKEAEKHK